MIAKKDFQGVCSIDTFKLLSLTTPSLRSLKPLDRQECQTVSIHIPVDGTIVERVHIQGKVYPVNEFGLRHAKRVLSRNERLTTYIRHSGGEIAVIKVGAMNVSSIKYVEPLNKDVEKGQELAYFEFGSTVVLLTEDHTFTLRGDLIPGKKVRMGESLGTLRQRRGTVSD